jgi:enoyl-CoA hydratase
MTARIRTETDGPVAILTLDRPEKLNALDLDLVAAIETWVAAVERDRDIRAAIITGAGAKAFSAGGDIHAWAGLDPISFGREWIREGHRVFDRLARLRQPLIAVLNGHAYGGGLELAACADIIVAEEPVKLGLPETGLGMVPGWSGTQRLVRRFGSRVVKRMALAGRIYTAPEALVAGIVDDVCPAGEGLDRGRAIAAEVCRRGPVAVQVVKTLINAAEGEEREAGLEAIAGALVATTEDLREGVASFKEKRPPTYRDR